MPDLAYMLRSIVAAWRLALRDPNGMALFDISLAGFWRSFSAAIVVAPFYLLLILLERQLYPDAPPTGSYLAVKGLFYVLSWAAYPLLMVPVLRAIGLGGGYVGFIIAYNWSAVIIIWVLLPPFTLYAAVGTDNGAAGFVNLLATVAVLYYRWFVTRTALATSGGLAFVLVVIDLLLSILLDVTGNRLLGM